MEEILKNLETVNVTPVFKTGSRTQVGNNCVDLCVRVHNVLSQLGSKLTESIIRDNIYIVDFVKFMKTNKLKI